MSRGGKIRKCHEFQDFCPLYMGDKPFRSSFIYRISHVAVISNGRNSPMTRCHSNLPYWLSRKKEPPQLNVFLWDSARIEYIERLLAIEKNEVWRVDDSHVRYLPSVICYRCVVLSARHRWHHFFPFLFFFFYRFTQCYANVIQGPVECARSRGRYRLADYINQAGQQPVHRHKAQRTWPESAGYVHLGFY